MKDSDINYPCKLDLKYDGVRCIAKVNKGEVRLFTRQGKRMNFPRIHAAIIKLVGTSCSIILDGELELHSDSRTGISGICNKNQKTGYRTDQDTDMVFYVFDMLPLAVFEEQRESDPQIDRCLQLDRLFLKSEDFHIRQAESHLCHTEAKVKELVAKWIAEGFEGGIVKDLHAPYGFKRTKAWLKQKAINSTTLKVVGTTEGTNKRKGKVGALVCQSSCGRVLVNVGSGITDEDLDRFAKKSPEGLFVEVLFNVLIRGKDSETFSLFLPRLKKDDWVRADKDTADSLQKIIKEHIGTPEI